MGQYCVSVTGLQLRRWWYAPLFWRHAWLSLKQVERAEGIVFADARRVNGVHHTLTVWTDERALKQVLYRGPHRAAIRVFPRIADGKTCRYLSDGIPSWEEALAEWHRSGRSYAGPVSSAPPAETSIGVKTRA